MSRVEKVAQAIKEEISLIIHEELKDPRIGFITITKVEVTKDLRFARIFFSVLGSDDEHRKTQIALESALGFIRKLLAESLQLRLAPEIAFKEDHSLEYSHRIEEVLNEIKEKDGPGKSKRVLKKKR